MADLVRRLRNSLTPGIWAMRCEAADRIEALEAALREIEKMGQQHIGGVDYWNIARRALEDKQ